MDFINFLTVALTLFGFQFHVFASPECGLCKAIPTSLGWPSPSEWTELNRTLSGRLIQAVPPAAPCHVDQPTYDNATCANISSAWQYSTFHDEDPVSVDHNNWNNESCLPSPDAPCSGSGYPVYVVNASTAQDVKHGVDFAREKNIRLIVKSSGHDYLGRSTAPNSMSIWTHHLQGVDFHSKFAPSGCDFHIEATAMTVGAGSQMAAVYEEASKRNQVVVGGMSGTVSVGGFHTGGGHSPLSSTYGLGADQVLEMEVVTSSGDILKVNECQNTDLFWALRGGGGASFGIVTSFTIKTFPSAPVSQIAVNISGALDSRAYWNTMAYVLSESPRLSDAGISGYTYIVRQIDPTASGYSGFFFAFNSSVSALGEIFAPILQYINTTWSDQILVNVATSEFPDFYSWWLPTNNASGVGQNALLGSRLLDRAALSQPLPVLEQALQDAVPYEGIAISHLVAGNGVRNAEPRGGGNAVLPAWRKAYVHFLLSLSWPPLNSTAKSAVEEAIDKKHVAALRGLNPDSGAYLNEASPNEPDYQQAFWGANYPRLRDIKIQVDPSNLFWCHPCVGDEGMKEVNGKVCYVE